MELTSHDLIEIMRRLTPAEQRAIERQVEQGLTTDISRAALRRIRHALKRQARAGRRSRGRGADRGQD